MRQPPQISGFRGGFPHSEIYGSKGARPSPQLFAACHVLHRLLAPRHPSNALNSLNSTNPMRGDERANKSTHLRPLARQCPFILSNPVRSAAQRRTNLLHDFTNNAALWPHTETLSRPESFVSLSPLAGFPFSGVGGARRDRTDDLKLAKLPLSQLSYGPSEETKPT